MDQLYQRVQQEIDALQSYVQSHQGYIRLVRIEDWNIIVRLEGACDTCPLSFYTITFGLEKKLQNAIDKQIKVIIED